MASVSDLVKQVSIDLNDYAPGHEFTTWSASQIASYLAEGIKVAYSFRPDLFLQTTVFKLTPGSTYQKPCNCTQIRKIHGVCDANGRVLYGIRKRKNSDKLQWYGKTCPIDLKNFRIRDYYIDADEDSIFVEPAPPAGQDVYVLIECAKLPDSKDITDSYNVSAELEPAIVQWALFRAKMVDSENNATIFSVAEKHRATCFQLLGIVMQSKDLIEDKEKGVAQPVRSVNG